MVFPLSGDALMAISAFLFGKMPAHGDFVARGLSAEAEACWDSWAAGEIETAQRRWGDRFGEIHQAAPPARLIAGPGPLGEGWRAGALVASVDAVGRRFILAAGVHAMSAVDAIACGSRVAQQVESLLYQSIADGRDADAAMLALAATSVEGLEPAVCRALSVEVGGEGAWWCPDAPDVVGTGSTPPAGFLGALLDLGSAGQGVPP